jgi:hypothetical protein
MVATSDLVGTDFRGQAAVVSERTLGALSAQWKRPRSRSATTASRRICPLGREDFLVRHLRHDQPRHFRIKPANAVAANDKVGRVENVALDEIEHLPINLRPFGLH